jgi:hypothetical protein
MTKARALSGGKNDGFHVRLSVDFAPTAFQMRP